MAWALIPVALAVFALLIAYRLSPGVRARKQVQVGLAIYEDTLTELRSFHDTLQGGLSQATNAYADDIRAERLRAISIDEFKKHGQGIRLAALRDAGLTTLSQLQGWTVGRLEAIRGIGPNSASQIATIVNKLTNEANSVPISPPSTLFATRSEEALLRRAYSLRCFESRTRLGQVRLEAEINPIRDQIAELTRAVSFGKWIFGFGKDKRTLEAVDRTRKLSAVLKGDGEISSFQKELSSELSNLQALNYSPIDKTVMLKDLEQNKSFYDERLTSFLAANNRTNAVSTPVPFSHAATIPVTVKLEVTTAPVTIPIPPKPANASHLRGLQATKFWTPAGKNVTVRGYTIPDGMVYVGSGLRAVSGGGPEPALIDPSLSVATQGNCHERHTPYWPNYSSIDEVARASYLHWLSTGKSDPEADIGYVFLALYGFERRLLPIEDPSSDPEIPLLEAEISRLLRIYGQKSRSFQSYASSLLQYSRARGHSIGGQSDLPEPELQFPFTDGLSVKIALGVCSKHNRPLPVNWALAWVLWAKDIEKPFNLGVCFEQFASLFREAYQKKFGEGMKLPGSVTRIKITHKQASASFSGMDFTVSIDLPDISVLSRPLTALKGITENCIEVVGPYRRFITHHPEHASTLDGLCLLPAATWPEAAKQEIKKVQSQIEGRAGRPYVLTLASFHSAFGGESRLKTKQLESLSSQLATVGLGIEPDVRFGAPLPKMSDSIALFRAEDGNKKLSEDFRGAATLVELASAVVSCGRGINEETSNFILNHVATRWGLGPTELTRLSAQLALYSVERPGNGPIRAFLTNDHVDSATRNSVCEFLLLAVLADGNADPEEIKALEKVYQGLGLDRTELYGRIHTASQALASGTTSTLNAKPASQPTGTEFAQFDLKRIAALRADSAKVSELLGEVFTESHEDISERPEKLEEVVQQSECALLGLDSEHDALLEVLIQRAQWTRAEVEEICTDRGLMLDGALERINEAAFNKFDCAILEGDDPIDVSLELLKELPA